MFISNYKKRLLDAVIVLIIFLIDRASKIYILKIAEVENAVDMYITPYLNFYLIWNKGIAFGLASFNESSIYNFMTVIIGLIVLGILILILKLEGAKKYSFMIVLGGA